MILDVQHQTRLRYAVPILRSMNLLRLAPAETPAQRRVSFSLDVEPPAPVRQYADHFGNIVHYFTIQEAHRELIVQARSRAVTSTRPASHRPVTWDAYRPERLGALLDFALQTALTNPHGAAAPARDGDDAWNWSRTVISGTRARLRYRQGVTRVDTPAAAVLAIGEGTCQDFAHVTLGLLRSAGIPARYTGGYQYLGSGARHEPHAWIEVWHPEDGWVGFDPTSGTTVDDRYVIVGVGRDYTEAAPLRGHLIAAPQREYDQPTEQANIEVAVEDVSSGATEGNRVASSEFESAPP